MLIITPRLKRCHFDYLFEFTRLTHAYNDPQLDYSGDNLDYIRVNAGLPKGQHGQFILSSPGSMPLTPGNGQIVVPSICSPILTRDNESFKIQATRIASAEQCKEWLDYIISNFIARWIYQINGSSKFINQRKEYILSVARNKTKLEEIRTLDADPVTSTTSSMWHTMTWNTNTWTTTGI